MSVGNFLYGLGNYFDPSKSAAARADREAEAARARKERELSFLGDLERYQRGARYLSEQDLRNGQTAFQFAQQGLDNDVTRQAKLLPIQTNAITTLGDATTKNKRQLIGETFAGQARLDAARAQAEGKAKEGLLTADAASRAGLFEKVIPLTTQAVTATQLGPLELARHAIAQQRAEQAAARDWYLKTYEATRPKGLQKFMPLMGALLDTAAVFAG